MTTAQSLEYFATKYGEPSIKVEAPLEVVKRLAPRLPKVMPEY